MRRDDATVGHDDEETRRLGEIDAANDASAWSRAADDAMELPRRENVNALTVVGLGGSAGSIPALEAFFQCLPAGSGPAYVVVLHLAPDHESRLAELLARSCSLPVSQVTETVHMERDHVYVIPPGKQLEMRDSTLGLHALEAAGGARTAIDTFFRTLAEAHGPQATAVVLSGTGADGTLGLRRIKEVGGLTVAQSPAEAEYDAMPRNAIATGQVDYVLPAAAMAAQIAAYWETSSRMRLPVEAAPSPEQRLEGPEPEAALRDILAHVRVQTGHDFSAYKRATVMRRIGRRLQVNGQESLPAYLDFLRRHPAETGALVGDLLISVTQFFRDPEAWQALERDIIPRLFPDGDSPRLAAPDTEPVRVWACGCATGEEAYTLAILLREQAARTGSLARLQVFATDMDADAIAAAREGVYPDTIMADVSEERLRRWFYRTEGGRYQVRKEVRETVLFASHDVLRDTPFSRMSLVTCRNLLIYLTPEAQQRVFETFHFALRPEGRLFLGTSESAEAAPALFGATDKPHRFFVRRPVARPILPVFTRTAASTILPALEQQRPISMLDPPAPPPAPRPVTGAGELHRNLLELYAPPSVLVDERYEVLHLSDGAGRFLRVVGGEPTRDLLQMVRPELRAELRTALFMAASEGQDQVRLARASLSEGRPPVPVRLIVRPVDAPEGARGYLLVFFQDLPVDAAQADFLPPILTAEGAAGSSDAILSGPPVVADVSAIPVVQQLEEENAHLQAQVRATVERYEALTEELKASNEELQAINEELRSAAEELETSKEELQSLNEELTTVNHELKSRVDEVSRANGDLQNFLASTNIGTIFLDRALRIRRYTPAAERLFQFIPTDAGRPLSDLTTHLDYPRLGEDAARVLERLETIEREVATADGQRHFLARLLPYRTPDDRIDGVVVNFVDITERILAEEALREFDIRYRAMADTAPVLIWEIDEGGVIFVNGHYLTFFGVDFEDLRRMGWVKFLHPDDASGYMAAYDKAFAERQSYSYECRFLRADGQYRWLRNFGQPVGPKRFVGCSVDITEEKRSEANLAFLAEVSQDLVRLTNVDETMTALSRKVGKHFNVSRVNFAQINEAAETAVVTHEWHTEGLADIAGERVYRLGDFISDEFFQATRQGEIMVVRDTRSDTRTDDVAYAPRAVRSFVTTPFVRDGHWLSLMSISDSEPRLWRDDEIKLLHEFTGRIWMRLERAHAEDALRESEERARALIANLPGGAAFIVNRDERYVLAEGEALTGAGDAGAVPETLPPRFCG